MLKESGAHWTMPVAGRLLRFGSARPRLVRCAFAHHPTVGVANILKVKSRNADGASLVVRQEREELFNGDIPPNAEIAITPQTAAELVLSLTLEPQPDSGARPLAHTMRIRPKTIAPKFTKIDVAPQARVGDSLEIAWAASGADSVALEIEHGGERIAHLGAPSDAFTLTPSREGLILLRLIAQGPHAKTSESRTVRVKMPKPGVVIEQPVQSGAPGTEAAFRWRITGAREAFIEAPQRNERHGVALEGGMAVTIGSEPEEFQLVAVGLDGSRYSEHLSTIPRLIACLDEP